jgi:hypothetical protein
MERPGSGYSVGTGRATTGGTGSGATINIQSVGATTYTTLVGGDFTGYTATGTFATPTITTIIGARAKSISLGSAATLQRPTTQTGVQVQAQIEASATNYGFLYDGGTPALSGTTNIGYNVETIVGTNCTNRAFRAVLPSATGGSASNIGLLVTGSGGTGASNIGLSVGANTATSATNIGADITSATGTSSTNIGIRVSAPSGGSTNVAMQFSAQGTTAAAGVQFGDGTDTRLCNWYRNANGVLRSDAEVLATHFRGTGSAPSASAGAGAGTSPTITVAGTDSGFSLTVAAGTSPPASNKIATITYAVVYGATVFPVFSAANSNAQASTAFVNSGAMTGTSFEFWIGGTALTASQTYIWNFKV